MTNIPEDIRREDYAAANAADIACQRNHCKRPECNGFLCLNAIDAVAAAAEKRGAERERERAAITGYCVCAETRHVTLGKQVAAAIRRGER